ncbi:unnamed protein product, partial [Prorocentrum cordatum]
AGGAEQGGDVGGRGRPQVEGRGLYRPRLREGGVGARSADGAAPGARDRAGRECYRGGGGRRRAGTLRVSVEGLPRPRLLGEFQEGDLVDGRVAFRGKAGVSIDIGCAQKAKLLGPSSEVSKLALAEVVKGLRIEKVDVETKEVHVSFPGLSDLVAGRPEKRCRDLRVGEVVHGRVAVSTPVAHGSAQGQALVDIGCEQPALLVGPRAEVGSPAAPSSGA